MAYDFGSNLLNIQNPFKADGAVRASAGLAISIIGIYTLLSVSANLESGMLKGWVSAGLGLSLLSLGLHRFGSGLFQLFRYFVGRAVPVSLAKNYNSSEKENSKAEEKSVVYDAGKLESMLMGRKNTTFTEPDGWLSRLIHTLIPSLIFMPYALRNYIQALGNLIATSFSGVAAFCIAFFVSASGLAGSAGPVIIPILSILLLLYLTAAWRITAKQLSKPNNAKLNKQGLNSVVKLLGFAIIVPSVVGFGFSKFAVDTQQNIILFIDGSNLFSAWFNLALLLICSMVVIGITGLMIIERLKLATPLTEVSEYRENLQESVHPNEIFINIENIVLANRRYKEVPNRVYREFKPSLDEQSQGKGKFDGNLLIETQPEFNKLNYSKRFTNLRLSASLLAQIFTVIAAVLLYLSVWEAYNIYEQLKVASASQPKEWYLLITPIVSGFMSLFFSWQAFSNAGKILDSGAFLFWAEMQFESLLLWIRTEGTYTESKVSTGMSIHDSTRSENTVVRSSITPWIISSRIVSSTYATVGVKNIEMPRIVLKLDKNDQELDTIISEIKDFLREREAIASITNQKDLNNAETIYQVNQQSRAGMNEHESPRSLEQKAAGKLRLEEQEEND
ncbi:MAG: hypothetical protein ACI93R_001103 [Flavobacteriales bacterium]|jgi:hypothetical protein